MCLACLRSRTISFVTRTLTRVVPWVINRMKLKLFLVVNFVGILNLGCTGIRFRRYVSNGFCTSRRPLRDMICDGDCLPMDQLPFFPNFSKIISRHKREWRCVADDRRTKKVKLICNDGTMRKYRVSVVRSCKCKRYTRKQNQTRPNSEKWGQSVIRGGLYETS